MTDAIIVAIISSSTTIFTVIVTSLMNKRKIEQYHKEVNGKMSELLDTTKKLGNAEGRADQKADDK